METGIVWVAKNSEKLVFPKIVILGGSVSSPTGHFPPTFLGGIRNCSEKPFSGKALVGQSQVTRKNTFFREKMLKKGGVKTFEQISGYLDHL